MIKLDPSTPSRPFSEFVARSQVMRDLAIQLERAAELDANVLISGPGGSGKSSLARLLHDLGPRASGPFVTISCATTPQDQLEAALFGEHGRPARGGTLLLDDVEEFPMALQARLIRLLQDRVLFRSGAVQRLDVRIVATTSVDLAARVREGRFREDLFYRLNVLRLRAPRLVDRRDDLPEIAERILHRSGPHLRLSPPAIQKLLTHSWPGNMRELENTLERAAAFSRGGLINAEQLEFADTTPVSEERPRLAGYTMEEIERWALLDTLELVGGNKAAAARSLGVCEKTIYNKLKRIRVQNRQVS
ncbi:MAG: sigma 54-interacting transcriptional regulator [Planctomycetota bacterium]